MTPTPGRREKPVGDEIKTLQAMVDHGRLMFFDRLIAARFVKKWPSGYEITQQGRAALAEQPRGDEGRLREADPQTAMRAVLLAYGQTRDEYGYWAKGAATHVFAALMGKLRENGWVLAASPTDEEERANG